MVRAAPESQSQPLSAEEELLKRNTDCVYFLASPLTCKKGSECEYRHSNIARVNPRDCYFWLHGDCSNWKCAFRHPPLEGLLGTQAPTSTGPTPTPHVPNEGVPNCVFFKKGYCMKGDWCPFLHTPNSLINKPSPMPVPTPPAANKKPLIGLEKSLQEKKDQPMNMAIKSVKNSAEERQTFETELASNRNKLTLNRKAPLTAPVSTGNLLNSSVHVQQYHHMYKPEPEPEHINSKDTEEFSRELSPGFDVLVDDDVRDTDNYPSEDGYDIGLSTDYNSIADNDERYRGSIGYDSHEFGWEQQRGLSYSEGRLYSRSDEISEDDGLDLRQHLEQRKKPNGLRSVITYENNRVTEFGDQRSYREENCNSSRENSLSSRLRGRINLPCKSQSPNNNMDNLIWGRLSQARVNINNGLKSYRGPHSRILVDSKNKRNREHSRRYVTDQQQSMGKRKHGESGNDISFEGPKPLEEILKRKRGEKNLNSGFVEDKVIEEGEN